MTNDKVGHWRAACKKSRIMHPACMHFPAVNEVVKDMARTLCSELFHTSRTSVSICLVSD